MDVKLIMDPAFCRTKTLADGWTELVISGAATLTECLHKLIASDANIRADWVLDDSGKVANRVYLVLNGKDPPPEGGNTPLKDGDEVRVVYLTDHCC